MDSESGAWVLFALTELGLILGPEAPGGPVLGAVGTRDRRLPHAGQGSSGFLRESSVVAAGTMACLLCVPRPVQWTPSDFAEMLLSSFCRRKS